MKYIFTSSKSESGPQWSSMPKRREIWLCFFFTNIQSGSSDNWNNKISNEKRTLTYYVMYLQQKNLYINWESSTWSGSDPSHVYESWDWDWKRNLLLRHYWDLWLDVLILFIMLHILLFTNIYSRYVISFVICFDSMFWRFLLSIDDFNYFRFPE